METRLYHFTGQRTTCTICAETIRDEEEVMVQSEGLAHRLCAGIEGLDETCPMCFMIRNHCDCD